jgi:hypothetical protein
MSLHNQVGRAGLEPAKAEPADLQSAPFAARDTDPRSAASHSLPGAGPRAQPPPGNQSPEPTMGLEPMTY